MAKAKISQEPAKKSKAKRKNSGVLPAVLDPSKPLKNNRYELFCQEYTVDLNKTQAAIRAKYSKKTAAVKGSQLLSTVSIKKRTDYLQRKIMEKSGVTAEMITAEFKLIAFGEVSKILTYKHKISALENLGKHVGWYSEDNKQLTDPISSLVMAIGANGSGLQIKN